ncbi:MAG: aminopeptidase, partial [Sphingomonas bacterium]|nr:aminopeptidase [Sphingomonas bacterium]
MNVRPLIAAASALLLAACQSSEAPAPQASEAPQVAPILSAPDAIDIHSYAKPLEARVTHVALDLAVDFAAKRVSGTATLDVAAKPGIKTIMLDDKGLEIEAITSADGAALPYQVGTLNEQLGAPLTIQIGDAKKIIIRYKSAPDSGALQWLAPEQTAVKKQSYLLSQGQAIENRSWIPTQDSPGVRQTWEAKIRVPAALTTVMSAPRVGEPVTDGDARIFSYKMDRPVAPYLI